MRRLHAFLIICLLFAAGSANGQNNTLLVVIDDVGVDMVAAYKEGASPPPTPSLDALAKRGVLFRNAYAAPTCSPTRAMLHVGRAAFRTGVGAPANGLPLAPSELTLPELVGSKGYAHALIGKWHLGGGSGGPNDAGWSHFAGALQNLSDYYNWTRTVNGRGAAATTYATTQNVDDALTWIKAQSKPWVVSLNFNAPHSPFHAPPSSLHSYNLSGLNPRRQPIPFFKAAMQAVDSEIGRLLAGLTSTVLAKTNVIVIGDNGSPGRVSEAPFDSTRGKGTVYENGVRVPLIIAGPGVVSGGREVKHMVAATDLYATIGELSGVDVEKTVPPATAHDAVSLVPYLAKPSQVALRKHILAESFGRRQTTLRSLRNDRYKLLRLGTQEEFYDLQADPFEKSNLLSRTLSSSEKAQYDALTAEFARLSADYIGFGAGCAASGGVPEIALVDRKLPQLGSNFAVDFRPLGSRALAALGILGFSKDRFASIPLPLALDGLSMPGCSLFVSADVFHVAAIANGAARWTLAFPNDSRLIGLAFYQQGLILDPAARGGVGATSSAGSGVLGGQ